MTLIIAHDHKLFAVFNRQIFMANQRYRCGNIFLASDGYGGSAAEAIKMTVIVFSSGLLKPLDIILYIVLPIL